jgi:hypothetical protein
MNIKPFRILYTNVMFLLYNKRSILPDSFSLREKARMRETPAITGHPESLTPTLSLRERE